MRFGVSQPISGRNKRGKKCRVVRVVLDEQVREPETDYFFGRIEAVLTRHCVITFRQISAFVGEPDLLICRKADIDRLIQFDPPDAFRAIFNERAITLGAFADLLLRVSNTLIYLTAVRAQRGIPSFIAGAFTHCSQTEERTAVYI